MKNLFRCGFVVVTIAGSVWANEAFGQIPLAAIHGTVCDPSGAVIGDATLTIRDKEIGAQRTVKTQRDGLYHVEISGINTSDFTLTGGVTRFQIENLPLNGRNFLELARLEPGVSVTSIANPGAFGNNYQRVSVAGAQYLETSVAVDGSTADDRINGGTALNVSQESVQEFQMSFNFDLSTGATGSGAVNIITRRGGNALHGTSFFYYRDHHLAAYPGLRRDPENPNPFFARRQSGFSLGGPFIKDRFFWFTNLEHNNQDGVFAVTNNHPIFSKLDVVQRSPLNFDLLTVRLDGNINDRHTAFLRSSLDFNDSIAPSGSAISMPSNWFTASTRAGQFQAGITSVLTPRFVSDLRFSHSYLNNILDAVTANDCPAPAACIGAGGPDILIFDAPLVRLGHHATVPKTMHTHTSQIVGNFTWEHGAHRFRFGGEWENLNLNSIHAFYDPPQITLWGPTDLQRTASLKPLYDALPETLKDPGAGAPTASHLLRLPLRSFIIGIGNPSQPGPYHHDQVSSPNLVHTYIKEGWAIRPALTLTYGLGYLQRTNIFNQDLERPSYLAPLVAGDLRPPHRGRVNLEPTAGLAWSLRQDGGTVVRLGAGLYHDDLDFFRPFLERGPLGPAGNGRVAVDGSLTGLSFLSMPTGFSGQDLLPLLPGIRSMLTKNQVINPITLPERFSNGDSFITQDVRITRKVRIGETASLSIIGEVFNLFNIANVSGYNNMINQVNYGQPSARTGQVFGSGGPRAFQFATRLQL